MRVKLSSFGISLSLIGLFFFPTLVYAQNSNQDFWSQLWTNLNCKPGEYLDSNGYCYPVEKPTQQSIDSSENPKPESVPDQLPNTRGDNPGVELPANNFPSLDRSDDQRNNNI